jgi:hypothetical protein
MSAALWLMSHNLRFLRVQQLSLASSIQAGRSKPQWEFPRLCRGGSKSLTYPAVDTVGLSMKLRIVEQPSHERSFIDG